MQELRIPAQIIMKHKYIYNDDMFSSNNTHLQLMDIVEPKRQLVKKFVEKKRKLDKRGPINMCVYK